jgi:hypothetical protein
MAAAILDERAAFEADYGDATRGVGSDIDPVTDQQLWRYIKYHAGGIRRSRKYWDSSLSWRENRAAFRYLDRGWNQGRSMDELASEMGEEWPWYGFQDEAGLWEWMQRTRRC